MANNIDTEKENSSIQATNGGETSTASTYAGDNDETGHVYGDGKDDPAYMKRLYDEFGSLVKDAAKINLMDKSSGVGPNAVRVIVAHPEFIDELKVSGDKIIKSRKRDANGNVVSVEYKATPSTSADGRVLHDEMYGNLADVMNNASTVAKTHMDSFFHDAPELAKGNRYAIDTERMRAALINIAMDAEKTGPGEYPENSAYAISKFGEVMDDVNAYIGRNYVDTPEVISKALGISVDRVKSILDEKGTAFGIPKGSQGYEHAKSLIPWFYFIVNEYGSSVRNSAADDIITDLVASHTAQGDKKKQRSDITDKFTDNVSFNLKSVSEIFKIIGSDESINILTTDFMNLIGTGELDAKAIGIPSETTALSDIHGDANGLMVGRTNVTRSSVKATLFRGISSKVILEYINVLKRNNPDKRDIYDNAIGTLNGLHNAFNTSMGRGGMNREKQHSIKDFKGNVEYQIEHAKPSASSKLAETAINNLKDDVKPLVLALGVDKGDDRAKSSNGIAFMGNFIGDPTLCDALADIDVQMTFDVHDAVTTGKAYLNTVAQNKDKKVNMSADDTGYAEVPFDAVGQRLGAEVAPDKLIPLFATTVSVPGTSDTTMQAIYNEVGPRLLHYIVSRNPGTVNLGCTQMYTGDSIDLNVKVTDVNASLCDYFAELSGNAREAIVNRTNWVNRLALIDTKTPTVKNFITQVVRNTMPRNENYDEEKVVSSVLDATLNHIKSNIFYAKQTAIDLSFSNSDIVPNGELIDVCINYGVNHAAGGRVLRKTGTGDGCVTKEGLRAARLDGGCVVTGDTPEFLEVRVGDETVRVSSEEEASEYIRPILVPMHCVGTYYALWVGLVPCVEMSHGVPANTLVTDDRVKEYHADSIPARASHLTDEMNQVSAASGAKADNSFDSLCSKIWQNIQGDYSELPAAERIAKRDEYRTTQIQSLKSMINSISDASGKELPEVVNKLKTAVTKLIDSISVRRGNSQDVINYKTQLAEDLKPVFTLTGIANGEMRNVLSNYSDNSDVAAFIKTLDEVSSYPVFKAICNVVTDTKNNGDIITDAISGDAIVEFIDAISDAKYSNHMNSLQTRFNGREQEYMRGDESLYERPAQNNSIFVHADDIDDIESLRNGMLSGDTDGATLTTYADEHKINSVSKSSTDYGTVFGERYPLLGMVKCGKGMVSHGTLRDGDSLCNTGLNAYDMKVLLGALDSAHSEISEIHQRYSDTNSAIAMGLCNGTFIVSHLIDVFYDLFSTAGSGSMLRKNVKLSYIELVNQCISRFNTIALHDNINTTLSETLSECVDALNVINDNPDVAGKITGIANVLIYLESINPANMSQGVTNHNIDFDSDVPASSSPYAKLIGTAYSDKENADKNLIAARNAFRNNAVNIYGANTKFGSTIAQMYYLLDRGETEGYESQYDQFTYMVDKLREKAQGNRVKIHASIATSDLMSQFVSAIIDDEDASGAKPYETVGALIKSLHSGTAVNSWYMLSKEPKMQGTGNNKQLDMDSQIEVKFGNDGKIVPSNKTGGTFNTMSDLNTALGVDLGDPSMKLVEDDDSVPDDVVSSVVVGVRRYITEQLLVELQRNNDVNPRLVNAFIDGADDIDNGSDDFVSLSLIMMLLYTRSIDRARYAEVLPSAQRLTRALGRGQVSTLNRKIADIDPSLSKIVRFADLGDDSGIKKLLDIMRDYAVAKLDGDTEKVNSIKSDENTTNLVGSDIDGFLNGFMGIINRSRLKTEPELFDESERDDTITKYAERYLGKVLRSDSSITDKLNSSGNVDTMHDLAGTLAQYRMLVGNDVRNVSDVDDASNEEAEGLRSHVTELLHSDELSDMVINGFLNNTYGITDSDEIMNASDIYVGQFVGNDPVFRSAVFGDSDNAPTMRSDLINTQGTMPLDDISSSRPELHWRSMMDILQKPKDARTPSDKQRATDLGITADGLRMVDSINNRLEESIRGIYDCAIQYVAKKKYLDANPTANGPRAQNARDTMEKCAPETGSTTVGRVNKLNDTVESIFDSDNKSAYAGLSGESSVSRSFRSTIDSIVKSIYETADPENPDVCKTYIDTVRSMVARIYAMGTKIYRTDVPNILGHLGKNTTLLADKISDSECRKLLSAIAKVDHNISVNATASGSGEDMVSIYGTPRTIAEARVLLNAAVTDYLKAGHTLVSADELLDNPYSGRTKDILTTLDKYLMRHSTMTSGTDVTPESVAPYIIAILVRSHCIRATRNGYARTVKVGAKKYECEIPTKTIVKFVSAGLSRAADLDSNDWMVALNTLNKLKGSAMNEKYDGNGNTPVDDVVNVAKYVKDSIVNTSVNLVKGLIEKEYDGSRMVAGNGYIVYGNDSAKDDENNVVLNIKQTEGLPSKPSTEEKTSEGNDDTGTESDEGTAEPDESEAE